ncbi:MAG: YhjD/YihY/BrkB family envelope integrity protein, partial [Acidimicrobiia bacterium]
ALLIAMFVAEALIAMFAGIFSDEVLVDTAWRVGSSLAPFAASALLLGLLYRFGTERRAAWPAVWRGTVFTVALLFVANWAYGIYLDLTGTSLVSLASSALVLMLLVYITAQVLLYGAEFIKVWQRRSEEH